MQMNDSETVSALCTAVSGAINIVRISGDEALAIAAKIWHGKEALSLKNARRMLLGTIGESEQALAVYMPKPRSYTGEDVVEIHFHGGNLAAGRLLKNCLQAGARPAEPGEFTFRAFINGKMDLTQAEGVADLINAHSSAAMQLAEKQTSGALSAKIRDMRSKLIEILCECESRIDFAEEDLDWQKPSAVIEKLRTIRHEAAKLAKSRTEGMILREGVKIVLAGRPNVGKSSLLNSLLGRERAIVTEIPGTTRDTIEEYASLRSIPVSLTDTAGIREADDLIENIGIDRSRRSIHGAQIVFWLLDASSRCPENEIAEMQKHVKSGHPGLIAVWNKCDMKQSKLPRLDCCSCEISVSNNTGIETLLDKFESLVWNSTHHHTPEIAVSSRHAGLLDECIGMLKSAETPLADAEWELCCVSLRAAADALGEISGETASIDILEKIFSSFCIGK